MAEKKATKKVEKIEREYTIPLRDKCRPVPRYKKTPKAVKTVKEFLVRHMQIRDRDLKKIKIDTFLNEQLWMRGIKKPLHKVKVKAIKEEDIVRVYAVDLPTKLEFKKKRLDKRSEKAIAQKEQQKSLMEKAKEQMQGGAAPTKEEAKKETTPEEKEKKAKEKKEKDASVEATEKKLEKTEAKNLKHTTSTKETGEHLERVQKSD